MDPHRPRTLRSILIAILLASVLLPVAAHSGAAVTAALGASSRDHFRGAFLAYTGSVYLKFDDMMLLGAQSGLGSIAGPSSVPIAGAAMVRLPFGRVVMPYAEGSLGWVLDDENDGFLTRAGGGFDIKNGRWSSLLLSGGYETISGLEGWYARGGLLLEF